MIDHTFRQQPGPWYGTPHAFAILINEHESGVTIHICEWMKRMIRNACGEAAAPIAIALKTNGPLRPPCLSPGNIWNGK